MYASTTTTPNALIQRGETNGSRSSSASQVVESGPAAQVSGRDTDMPHVAAQAVRQRAGATFDDVVVQVNETVHDEGAIVLRDADFDPAQRHSLALRFAKRGVDVAGSLMFFVFFGWLYLALAVGVWITSGRPVLFSQKRYGYKGELFEFYKFRSMVPNAEEVLQGYLARNPEAAEQWNKFQKLDNDPRITSFGRFIRKTSLDELPQFWNVLKGDMSLVGPRPCLLSQKKLYGKYWSSYTAVRPGITGLWQVSGRNTVSYRRRVLLDVQYVQSLSVHRDIYIFLKTIWVVATGHGSR